MEKKLNNLAKFRNTIEEVIEQLRKLGYNTIGFKTGRVSCKNKMFYTELKTDSAILTIHVSEFVLTSLPTQVLKNKIRTAITQGNDDDNVGVFVSFQQIG